MRQQIVDVAEGESIEDALARSEGALERSEAAAQAAIRRGAEEIAVVQAREVAMAVETPEEVARLAAVPDSVREEYRAVVEACALPGPDDSHLEAALADAEEVSRLAGEAGPEDRYQDEQDPEVREGWHIDNLSSLDWALSRIADLEAEQAENEEVLGAQIDRLRAKHERLTERIGRGLRFFRSHVEAFAQEHRAELTKGGKAKSRKLLHGTVGWRKVPAKAVVIDEAALLEWARAQPVEAEALRIKEAPNWSAIKKQIEESGEVLPGTDYQPEGEALTIKTESGR